MANNKTLLRWLAVLAVLLCLISISHQSPVISKLFSYRPQVSVNYDPLYDACKVKEEVQTLCQRCAKSTKSNIVYPMCCMDQEEARTWCYKYTNFGIH